MAESWQSQAANGSGHVSFQKSKKWAINEGIIQKLPWDTSHGAMRDRNGHKLAQNDGVGLIGASFIGCPRVPVSWCPSVLVSLCLGVPMSWCPNHFEARSQAPLWGARGWDERQQGHGGTCRVPGTLRKPLWCRAGAGALAGLGSRVPPSSSIL